MRRLDEGGDAKQLQEFLFDDLQSKKDFGGPCRRRSRVSNYEFGKAERLLSRITVHRCVSVGFRFLPQLEC